MPAPIISGLIGFIQPQLNVNAFDGEIPRYDPAGNPISPSAKGTSPTDWPVFRVTIKEPGFVRTWTTEDAYSDEGTILIDIYGTRREQTEPQMDTVEQLLSLAGNWAKVTLPPTAGTSAANAYYIIQMLLESWWSGQEEGVRTARGELLYRCDLVYSVMIHGAISTL